LTGIIQNEGSSSLLELGRKKINGSKTSTTTESKVNQREFSSNSSSRNLPDKLS
jgi:hypothetical protein